MTKQEINKNFIELKEAPCYVYISCVDDVMYIKHEKDKLSEDKVEKEKLCIFSNHAFIWDKKDICELIDAFYIRTIVFPNNKAAKTSEFKIIRPLNYADNLKRVQAPYLKKIIFLERKTRTESLLFLLSRKSFIVLANVKSPDSINIDIYLQNENDKTDNKPNGNKNTLILPIFSDSDTLREFLKKEKEKKNDDVNNYQCLIMKFSEIARYIKKFKNCDIYINPASYAIKGKNFSFRISSKLLHYMSEIIEPKFSKK